MTDGPGPIDLRPRSVPEGYDLLEVLGRGEMGVVHDRGECNGLPACAIEGLGADNLRRRIGHTPWPAVAAAQAFERVECEVAEAASGIYRFCEFLAESAWLLGRTSRLPTSTCSVPSKVGQSTVLASGGFLGRRGRTS